MSRTLEYEKLLAELLPVLELKILESLLQAPKGLTRKGLIRIVFREEAQTNLGNDTQDRKIRKGIARLQHRVDAAQNSYLLFVKNFDTKRDGV